MGIDTYDHVAAAFEHTDGALSRPAAFPETARYGGCWTQKKMFSIDAGPGFFIKDNDVLPEGR